MGGPLLMLSTRPWRRTGGGRLRRVAVEVPTEVQQTEAIFLVMRRMRGPILTLIAAFTISILGLTLIPGVDQNGNTWHMSAFDAMYFMSYTANTIGFGELPHPFNTAQRMWVIIAIFMSVIGWAYCIGALLNLLQQPGFKRAVALQRFGRKVRHMREPFTLIAGYGQAGRTLAAALDRTGRRIVVLDEDPERLEILVADQLLHDVPYYNGDPRNPGLLGLSGLGHKQCEGVMAMTDKDEQNLAVIMAAHLLRPDIPVITRCSEKENTGRMADYRPQDIINPFERYGAYLVLALQKPGTHRFATWLLNEPGTEMPGQHDGLGDGKWVVCADDRFGSEVANDLRQAGLEVEVVDPADGDPDVKDAIGMVAGAESDTTNLSLAAHARLQKPEIYLTVRQKSIHTGALLRAFAPDSVFIATDLVAFETLARLEAPLFWKFIEFIQRQDDQWSRKVMDQIVARVGERTPTAEKITLGPTDAPAVCRWLEEGTLTLGQLLSHPDNRDEPISVFPTMLVRDGEATYVPDLNTKLRKGDQLGLLTRSVGLVLLRENLTRDVSVEYCATGEAVPGTWFWRVVTGKRPRCDPDQTTPTEEKVTTNSHQNPRTQ